MKVKANDMIKTKYQNWYKVMRVVDSTVYVYGNMGHTVHIDNIVKVISK